MSEAKWNDTGLYGGYLRNVQQIYEKEPVLRASLQVILSIFAVAFFAFFAIRPTLSTISTLIRKIEDQRKVDQQLDSKIQQLSRAEENLAIYGQELEGLLKAAVPEEPEVDRLARLLEAVSIESGAYITSLAVQESPLVGDNVVLEATKESEGDDKFVTFAFSIGGTQEEIRKFIEGLQKLERQTLIANVTIDLPGASQKGSFILKADGKATVYYLPEVGK